jgi:hypothetical protein
MPQHRPTHVGDVCWNQSYVSEMLSPIAQVDQAETDWFLATHSPITSTDGVGPVEQQALLDDLLSASRRETLVVLKGDPGTGKSQLINWLKLGFDAAIVGGTRSSIGDRTLRSVLIRRRSGSLKDALQQLVDQLPGYERYLDQISAAIAGISGEAANRRLYTEMHHALLGARAGTPRALKELEQVFIDNGAASWLCRQQGAIDRNIKRLTEQSDTIARESLPLFTSEDFEFPAGTKVGFDEDLKLRLEDDEDFRERAAARANEYLRHAIAGVTGLRGHTLNEIFRAIREEMQRRGEALALFVEDVSTLSVLDEELVNALQPLNDRSLCPLLSVLGMTEPAYGRLPDNLKGRVDRVLTLSGESSMLIPNGGNGADLFVARYLNAIRSGPMQMGLLAEDARRHGEVRHSACEDCSLKSKCFAAFGSVDVGGSEVGLYPLSPGSAARLLDGLNTDTNLRTPRTLLQFVVRPLLGGMATEFRGATVGLPIHPRAPLDLNTQQERLLAGWTAEQRGRMSYLLYYWTGAEALADGASVLSPMLPWFRQPAFSSVPPLRPHAPVLPKPPVGVPATEQRVPETDRRYQDAIARLETWFGQQRTLIRDREYRTLLAAVVNKSLVLDDVRTPSSRIRRLSLPINAANIVIEDMTSRPAAASKARFEFTRSQDVFDLLRDLLSFEYLGGNSWRFDGGQEASRRYAKWLEDHREELVRAFNVVKCDRDSALRAGIRFLRLAYRFSLRKDVPSDRAAAVEAIASFVPGTIGTLSDAARAVAADLPQRLQTVRNLIFDDLAVRQGERGGVNFIDPRPLIEHLSVTADDLSLGELDIAATMADYPEIGRMAQSRWGELPAALKDEAAALRKRIDSLDTTLRQWGLVGDSVPQMLREYLEGARAVIKACEAANESLGDGPLQSEIGNLAPAVVGRHVAIVEQVVSILDQGWLGVLTLDVGEAEKTFDFVTRSDRAIGRLRDALAQRLSDIVTGEDVDAERQACLGVVQQLTTSATENTETSGATSA